MNIEDCLSRAQISELKYDNAAYLLLETLMTDEINKDTTILIEKIERFKITVRTPKNGADVLISNYNATNMADKIKHMRGVVVLGDNMQDVKDRLWEKLTESNMEKELCQQCESDKTSSN